MSKAVVVVVLERERKKNVNTANKKEEHTTFQTEWRGFW